MRLRDNVIGALNVFGEPSRDALDADESRVVQALADVATIAILQERAIRRGRGRSPSSCNIALNSRIVIEQAKGAVARSQGVSVGEAFARMRSHARERRIRLTDLALAIVETPEGPLLLPGD